MFRSLGSLGSSLGFEFPSLLAFCLSPLLLPLPQHGFDGGLDQRLLLELEQQDVAEDLEVPLGLIRSNPSRLQSPYALRWKRRKDLGFV